uniref:G-protein coupled receptors family 1 profile domain-containing protein n=1 Tax=Plectus sambesii TaxID=2011161 RepID=A0A914WN07_9BILA
MSNNDDLMMPDDYSSPDFFDTSAIHDESNYLSSDLMSSTDDIVWCFDLPLYYMNQSGVENISIVETQSFRLMNLYGRFSFFVNGLATLVCAVFGGIGNMLLLCQIRRAHYFSRRLAAHLAMLCLWDTLLLMSGLFSYGVLSLYYGMYPFHALSTRNDYAVNCSFLAVSRPLEQRTRKAQFSVKWICLGIAVLALLLNLPMIPLERSLVPCYVITEDSIEQSVMNMPTQLGNNPIFALLVHLIPDLIFRCPFPIVLVAVLTIRTMQLCRKRTVGANLIQVRHTRNVPFMLTLLNIKFVLCNTLYMFNTIVMEIMGYGYSSKETEMSSAVFQQFVITLYLTDLANMLLAAHSATNWLLFYRWPKFGGIKRTLTRASTLTNSLSKRDFLNVQQAKTMLEQTNLLSSAIAADQQLIHQLFPVNCCPESGIELNALQHSFKVCNFLLEIIKRFADKNVTLADIREDCRRVGRDHQRLGVHLTTKEWKRTSDALIQLLTQTPPTQTVSDDKAPVYSSRPPIAKVVNFVISEMKSGAFCEAVAVNGRCRLPTLTHSVVDHDCSPLLQAEQRSAFKANVKRNSRSLNSTPVHSTKTIETTL